LFLFLEFQFEGFSRDVCRSMVAMMDIDRSGKLGLDEFIALWKSIRTWKVIYFYLSTLENLKKKKFKLERVQYVRQG